MPFEIAADPGTDYRELVRTAYDRCAEAYAGQRRATAGPELGWITGRLTAGSKILDVGCGAGVPVARQLAASFRVTGIDISPQMTALASRNVPAARIVTGDATEIEFPAGGFDAIVSFYAIFHVPREDHPDLFRRFARWLRPGGLLLVTVAAKDDGPGYTEDGFFGQTMYWSNFGPERYRRLLAETGFRIEREGVVGGGFAGAEADEETHPILLAVRGESGSPGSEQNSSAGRL